MKNGVVCAPRPCSNAREVCVLDSVTVVDVTSVDTALAEPDDDEDAGSTENAVETVVKIVVVDTVAIRVSMPAIVAVDAADKDWADSADSSTEARLGATGNFARAGI